MVCSGVERCVCWSKVWCVLEWGVECAGVKFGVCWSGALCVLEWGVEHDIFTRISILFCSIFIMIDFVETFFLAPFRLLHPNLL